MEQGLTLVVLSVSYISCFYFFRLTYKLLDASQVLDSKTTSDMDRFPGESGGNGRSNSHNNATPSKQEAHVQPRQRTYVPQDRTVDEKASPSYFRSSETELSSCLK
jgi:hypothetical protein